MGVLHLDKLAYGEDRRELISEHFYASRVFMHKGRVLGTYMPLLMDELIVAENSYAGCELLRWHLPHVTEVPAGRQRRRARVPTTTQVHRARPPAAHGAWATRALAAGNMRGRHGRWGSASAAPRPRSHRSITLLKEGKGPYHQPFGQRSTCDHVAAGPEAETLRGVQ
ncbi:MAG: hypothetical protein IPI55_16130 [Flavobacteriales bacterium]|nr:hypothetical protein [Flavobacteriales bacterium]